MLADPIGYEPTHTEMENPVEVLLVVMSTAPRGPRAPIVPPPVVGIEGIVPALATPCQSVPLPEIQAPERLERSTPTAMIRLPSDTSTGLLSFEAKGNNDVSPADHARPSSEDQKTLPASVKPEASKPEAPA